MVENEEFRIRRVGASLRRVSSFAVPACRGAAGRRVSLARCADGPGSPAGPALALGCPAQVEGTEGCLDVGPVREGFCPSGMGVASALLDETACASIPLRGKGGGAHIHAHTPAHIERAARTSTCHSRHERVARARFCVGM